MAYCALKSLLENLSRLLTSHAGLFSGAEEEFYLLMEDLVPLRSLLENCSTKLNKRTQLREDERRIRKVVSLIEDTIDVFYTRLATTCADPKNISGRRRDPIILTDRTPADLAQHVRSLIKNDLQPFMDTLTVPIEYNDEEYFEPVFYWSREEKPELRMEKALSIMGDRIIGLEDEERTLMNTLYNSRIDIIALLGKAGMGKTTMAWKVYHSEEVQQAFPTRIWANVSREFNPRTLFLGILHEFTSKDMSSQTVDDLAMTIRTTLKERSFLLVLDDVWTAEAMSTIISTLPWSYPPKGKVIVTTRSQKVAQSMHRLTSDTLRLRFLTNDQGWQLLQLKVFGMDRHTQLQGLGRHISERCQGIPMLLLMVAGILKDYLSTEGDVTIIKSWIDLSASLDKCTRSGTDIFASILGLSCNRMHDELRDCFLYLGTFPEDYEIPVWTLTRLWVSEGFVQPKQGQSLEDRAYENLMDLINRNLVMVDKHKSNGKVKTCRIHDTVHDFCKVEGEGKEILFQELRKSADGSFKPSQNSALLKDQHRRICVHSNVVDFFSPEPYAPHARSFLSFSLEEYALRTEDIPKIPGAFELVRVLHMRPLVFRIFPLGLTKLVLLKYLVLSSDFKVLPEAISRLSNMLTLVIHTSSRTLTIKADIWRSMVHLRDLKTNASITLHKKQSDCAHGGQHLRTLANVTPDDCTLDLFQRARHLKKLGIRGTLTTMNFDNMRILTDLENLKLLEDDIQDITTPVCLPLPDKFPPKLRILTLSATLLSWKQMAVLGMLENLEVLKLKDNAFVGRCWEVGPNSFRRLEVLHIGHTDIVSWKASGHDFPRLKCLMLSNCEELECLPEELADVPCLEKMGLHRLSKTAVASARKIREKILQDSGGRGFKLLIFPQYE